MRSNKIDSILVKNSLLAEKAVDGMAIAFSVLGCLSLLVVVFTNVISIIGRVLFGMPIVGDFELVEMSCAVAVFMFLPLCQIRNGNIIIDAFTWKFGFFTKNIMDLFAAMLFCAVAIFFSARMMFGLLDMLKYQEQTMLLQIPIWIPFVPAILSFSLLSVTCVFSIYRKILNLVYGRQLEWIG